MKMKKVLSLFLALLTVVTMFSFGTVDAYAATQVYKAKGYLWSEDMFEDEFSVNSKQKIKFEFSCQVPAYVSVYSLDTFNDVLYKENTKKFTTTASLAKGDYKVLIILGNDDSMDPVKDYSYSLTATDVTSYASKISMTTTKKTMSAGTSTTLKYKTSPSGSVAKSISWSSSNTKVATVNKSGKVTAKGLGKATITAKLNNGKKTTCTITVNKKDIYVFASTSRTLPQIGGKKKVTWKNGKKSIAKVNSQKIKGVKQGATSVTATYSKVKYTCNIYVVNYNKLYNKCKSELKDQLKDPDSLKIYHVWRGYDKDGDPTIQFDYGAKISYGAYVRNNYVGYYHYNKSKKKFQFGDYFPEYLAKLSSEKKMK